MQSVNVAKPPIERLTAVQFLYEVRTYSLSGKKKNVLYSHGSLRSNCELTVADVRKCWHDEKVVWAVQVVVAHKQMWVILKEEDEDVLWVRA